MKINVLRKDLRKILKGLKLLIVNGNSQSNGKDLEAISGNGAVSTDLKSRINELKSLGVEVVALTDGENGYGKSYFDSLGVETIYDCGADEGFSLDEINGSKHIGGDEVGLFCGNGDDGGLIERVKFSAVSMSADLDLKTKAYYVAYGDYEDSLNEVLEVIIRAKNSAG